MCIIFLCLFSVVGCQAAQFHVVNVSQFFMMLLPSMYVHFTISHQGVKKHVCKIPGCNRAYGSNQPFRKHLIYAHNVPACHAEKAPVVPLNSVTENVCEVAGSVCTSCDNSSVIDKCDSAVNEPNVNVKDLLFFQQDYLVAKLYSNSAFPRYLVDTMVSDFSAYLTSPFFERLRNTGFLSLDPTLEGPSKAEIIQMFGFAMNPFDHLSSEFKRLHYFQELGEYIPPEPYDIVLRQERSGSVYKMKKVQGQFIPCHLKLHS